jgi:hypothetical protein
MMNHRGRLVTMRMSRLVGFRGFFLTKQHHGETTKQASNHHTCLPFARTCSEEEKGSLFFAEST